MNKSPAEHLASLVFAAWTGNAEARDRLKKIALTAEDAKWDEEGLGECVIAKSYSGIVCGIDFHSDPVTLAVQIALLLYGERWPFVLPGYLQHLNKLWGDYKQSPTKPAKTTTAQQAQSLL